jgi:nucleotide-binding universal stress UspA family protein
MRPQTLLVGTDFSEYADRAFSAALSLAAQFDASLELLHVVDTPIPFFEPYTVSLPDTWLTEIRIKHEKNLTEQVQRENKRNIKIEVRVLEGNPALTIAREAERISADLVIVGSRGQGGIKHALLGSVAERIVRESQCNVLTIQDASPPQKLLVGTDLSTHSDYALSVAAELAHEFNATLELVHAIHVPVAFVTPYETVIPETTIEEVFNGAEQDLRRLAKDLTRDLVVRTSVLAEPPHSALCDAAERDKADLIVVGAHEHSGLKRMMLGGVAERVLRNAPCSVLIVRVPN